MKARINLTDRLATLVSRPATEVVTLTRADTKGTFNTVIGKVDDQIVRRASVVDAAGLCICFSLSELPTHPTLLERDAQRTKIAGFCDDDDYQLDEDAESLVYCSQEDILPSPFSTPPSSPVLLLSGSFSPPSPMRPLTPPSPFSRAFKRLSPRFNVIANWDSLGDSQSEDDDEVFPWEEEMRTVEIMCNMRPYGR